MVVRTQKDFNESYEVTNDINEMLNRTTLAKVYSFSLRQPFGSPSNKMRSANSNDSDELRLAFKPSGQEKQPVRAKAAHADG